MHTNHFKQRAMTCNETCHKIKLRHRESKFTQVLVDVSHTRRYPETSSRITLSNALTKSTNKTKKDFLLFLQISMNVTKHAWRNQLLGGQSHRTVCLAWHCCTAVQSLQPAFCTEACHSETSGVSHASCHTRLDSLCVCKCHDDDDNETFRTSPAARGRHVIDYRDDDDDDFIPILHKGIRLKAGTPRRLHKPRATAQVALARFLGSALGVSVQLTQN